MKRPLILQKANPTKVCRICSVELVPGDQGGNWQMGRLRTGDYICGECYRQKQRKWSQRWRDENREHYRQYQREYQREHSKPEGGE